MAVIRMREMAAAVRTLARGDLARYGHAGTSQVSLLEADLCRTMDTRHALAVNSGTSALIDALVGTGIGPGDEVLVPAYTWVATAAAVLAVGAVPVLVEIDESLTMDPTDLESKITPATRAVIPVHMLNLVCDMDAIMKVAADNSLAVIEDACQAIGVRHHGRRVGSIGDAGVFSFNQHKNITAGEGGAIITGDTRLHTRAAMHHDVGSYERPGWVATEPLFPGVNHRMPELSAAILRPQLARIDAQLDRRRRRREIVLDALSSGGWRGVRTSPHHDPADAVGLALTFDDPSTAVRFGSVRGARRLADTGRHVYTNWQSMTGRGTRHPRFDPHSWVERSADYGPDACPTTLEILTRSCTVELAPELPTPAFRLLTRPMRGRVVVP